MKNDVNCNNINNLFGVLNRDDKKQGEYIVFGTASAGKLQAKYLKKKGYHVASFIDNYNLNKWIGLKRIYKPAKGATIYPNAFFLISSLIHQDIMIEQLLLLGIRRDKIICPTQKEMDEIYHYFIKVQIQEDRYFIYHHPVLRNSDYYKKIWWDYFRTLYLKIYPYRQKFKNIKYKYNVSICAIFKNESIYMREWIEYHKLIGIQHFYLYNNLSDDDYKQVLQEYIDEGSVSLEEWPYPQAQIDAYINCIQKYGKESEWLGFIDLDEFVVPIVEDNIYNFLKKYNKHVGSILIYWKIFGSSGIYNRNLTRPVIGDFTKCWGKSSDVGKCFYNTRYMLADKSKNTLLHHDLWTINGYIDLPPMNIYEKICSYRGKQRKPILKKCPIQINHYVTKSYKEYQKKIKGTDVFFEKNPHTNEMFYFHEEKCSAIDRNILRFLPMLEEKLKIKQKGEN